MDGSRRIKMTDLNPNLICVLCGGYLIDATTLTECLHSFCKKCIIRYLDTSKHCPVCDVMVHKTRPHQNIRSDKTLQDLVYKLVPGLYKNEMKRRRDYYTQHPDAAPRKVGEARGDENAERIIYTEDEHFSLALHFCSEGIKDERSVRTLTLPEIGATTKESAKDVRYLQCPASVTIAILKKFIRLKYELPHHYQIDVFHTDEALRDEYTLMDVAYIYTWRRREPLKLNYSVYEFTVKRTRMDTSLTRVGLDLKPRVKVEGKPAAKPEGKPGKQDAKSAKLDKPPVKQETSDAGKRDSQTAQGREQGGQTDTGARVSTPCDKGAQAQAQAESQVSAPRGHPPVKAEGGEVLVGHVADVTARSTPKVAPSPSSGKKFFPNKTGKSAACGVKVLQSSKPQSASSAIFTGIQAGVGGGARASPVSKHVKIAPARSPAAGAQKNGTLSMVTVGVSVASSTGQDGAGNAADPSGKTPGQMDVGSLGLVAKCAEQQNAKSAVGQNTRNSPAQNAKTSAGQTSKGGKQMAGLDKGGKQMAGLDKSGKQMVGLDKGGKQIPGQDKGGKQIPALDKGGKQMAGLDKGGKQMVRPDKSGKQMAELDCHKVGEAAGAAASAADPGSKTGRQLQPPPAASPATSVTVSLPSNPVTLTSSSRSSDSPTITQSSHTVSSPTVAALSAPTLPAAEGLSVPQTHTFEAGAAAAGGDTSPAPAALAASSSPSPPMSAPNPSKDASKQFPPPPSAAPIPVTTPSNPPSSPSPSLTSSSVRAATPSLQTCASSGSVSTSISVSVAAITRPAGLGPAPTPIPMTTSTSSNATKRVLSPKPVLLGSDLDNSPAAKKARKSSPARALDGIGDKFNNPNSNNNNNNVGSSNNGAGLKVPVGSQTVVSNHVSCNAVTRGTGRVCNGMPPVVTRMPRVSNAATAVNTLSTKPSSSPLKSPATAGLDMTNSQTTVTASSPSHKQFVSSNSGQKQAAVSRTLQKQPVAVSTPQKGSVAASSTPQKQPAAVSASQKQPTSAHTPQKVCAGSEKQSSPHKASSTPNGVQRTVTVPRPGGASTPIPIQPAGLTPTSHSLVRASAGSAIAVAMARRASEMQQAFVQQQQQQLILQQHLLDQQRLQHFLQQQQLLNLQVAQAAAARWKSPQSPATLTSQPSTTLTPIPISQIGVMVSGASSQTPTSSTAETAAVRARPTSEGEGSKKGGGGGEGGARHAQSLPALSKKPSDLSASKKKISDIANTLHRKVSQSQGQGQGQAGANNNKTPAPPTGEQRPPHAHTTASAANTPDTPSTPVGKGEDEPLNLSLDKDSPRAADHALPSRDSQPVVS